MLTLEISKYRVKGEFENSILPIIRMICKLKNSVIFKFHGSQLVVNNSGELSVLSIITVTPMLPSSL